MGGLAKAKYLVGYGAYVDVDVVVFTETFAVCILGELHHNPGFMSASPGSVASIPYASLFCVVLNDNPVNERKGEHAT